MKKAILMFVAVIALATGARAGEIQVYDANDQFIGILLDHDSLRWDSVKVFVPTLNAFTTIPLYERANPSEFPPVFNFNGNIKDGNLYINHATGEFFTDGFDGINILFKVSAPCSGWSEDKYFVSAIPDDVVHHVDQLISFGYNSDSQSYICFNKSFDYDSMLARATEILKQDIPFSQPIAVPLRLEYFDPTPNLRKGDTDFDGDVDGDDLATVASEFGK